MNIETILLYALLLLNVLGLLVMCLDKYFAIRKKQRIRESTLMIISVIGGSMGVFLGVYFAHHKTLHKKFTVGVPAIIIVQLTLAYLILT